MSMTPTRFEVNQPMQRLCRVCVDLGQSVRNKRHVGGKIRHDARLGRQFPCETFRQDRSGCPIRRRDQRSGLVARQSLNNLVVRQHSSSNCARLVQGHHDISLRRQSAGLKTAHRHVARNAGQADHHREGPLSGRLCRVSPRRRKRADLPKGDARNPTVTLGNCVNQRPSVGHANRVFPRRTRRIKHLERHASLIGPQNRSGLDGSMARATAPITAPFGGRSARIGNPP